jgi:hypothetical protein
MGRRPRSLGGTPPATIGFGLARKKPTISWAFVLYGHISMGFSTGLPATIAGQ